MNFNNKKVDIALKKAETSLQKIRSLLEAGEYCIDIIQQNLAVIGLLKSINEQLLDGHLQTCFRSAMQLDNEKKQEKMIQEILKIMRLAHKK